MRKNKGFQVVVSCFVEGRKMSRLSAWTEEALAEKFNLSPNATFKWAPDCSSVVLQDGTKDLQITRV